MLIDCDVCRVRGPACGDCVVTVLLGSTPQGVHLDPEERDALDVLAASGLVPPLRLVVLGPPVTDEPPADEPDLADGVVFARRHARPAGQRHHHRHVG
jgi:hypothetical protein